MNINVYFSDIFNVSEDLINEYGAFNISLINDVPLFIDPFLLFGSEDEKYQELHKNMLKYLYFLKENARQGKVSKGLLKSWYCFPEVKQNWFGFSKVGNCGRGLGLKFGRALNDNLHSIFANFGEETVTSGKHLEKLCIIKDHVGRDNISDFTTNLIKDFLLEYTQTFALEHIDSKFLKRRFIPRVYFDYKLQRWHPKEFTLPYHNGDYAILTPKNILTKDDNWINASDMHYQFEEILNSVPDGIIRAEINNFLRQCLPEDPTKDDERKAYNMVYREFTQLMDYYIKYKEDNSEKAISESSLKVQETENLFIHHARELITQIYNETNFYEKSQNTYDDAIERINFLKDVIENKDGYRLFYLKGKPIQRETDLHIMYRLTWFASPVDVNREVNNGRGPVDFKLSNGDKDKTLVEFKLAKNTGLKKNLQHQVEIYKKANNTKKSIKCILYFSPEEYFRVKRILEELFLSNDKNIILINASKDDKISASKATSS